jgi:molybdopterin/thiamine biosynthesis adenylyltransferase
MSDPQALLAAGGRATERSGRCVLVAGAGNIGSHLVPLLARAGIGSIRVVDRDRIEAKNLATQDFHPDDVGGFKAEVLAERMRRQFPHLTVAALACDLEDVPLGEFEVDVLLGALDSRRARQVLVSEIGWPLGVPVIDGGVGEGWLGRVQVFVPGPEAACLECTWGAADYRQLAAEYPCLPGAAVSTPPTVSPAFAGTVVAGLMTAECVRLLEGPRPVQSHETCFDLMHRRFLTSRLRRSPRCRFDHIVVGQQHGLDDGATVGDLLAAIARLVPGRVRLEGRRGLFGGDRFATSESLLPRAHEPLAELGCTAGDRIRASNGKQSVFVLLDGGEGFGDGRP